MWTEAVTAFCTFPVVTRIKIKLLKFKNGRLFFP